ncbi:MAG: class I SAM-dependent methyltransferase [Actinomycetota bacterium]|nr:class I SAM-dependent methyltransferase [Actinomycetota bacterium]
MVRFAWKALQVADLEVQLRTCDEPPSPGAVYLCPSVGEYPIYDDSIYQVMLEDERRNTLFRRAIEAAAPGATVLEIGCGPDLLWTLAAMDAGASRAYAIEVIEVIARRAEQTARGHPSVGIRVVAGDATSIALPERADLCIAEIIGCIGGSEGIVAVLADARRRHLSPSAKVIPSAVRTLAGAVCLLDVLGAEVAMPSAFAPYVEAVLQQAGLPFDLRLYVGGVDAAALMSTTGVLEDLRFSEQSYLQGGDLRLEITRRGRVDGLLAWIELAVAPGDAVLDSLAEDTNWLPVYVPFTLGEPIEVSVGDVLSLQVTVRSADDGIHPEYFFRGQLTRSGSDADGDAGGGAGVAVSAESRYSGGAFRATVLHRALLRWP